ncbi:Methyl-viologen-reducing hydrogenase, delta subunit [Acididesulfobacillus acetoxydans]|uniref:CoB--CoM heterodisulfide reductase-like protein n=1 Tax=Acididesulfobacillus acetoxydans TaxID=1561005 RepID=A0A8S0XXL2_9FIRM|nr:hydrogenase iron-sulfur subunit [Acididesulfobacillus acetoxydans]CAA7601847.1 Methyl-viologen-reducing hydrogenase, delta subunit [Acididesulfobacillus acetoxydans]CEJ06846.1 CoB--CoM heterodisulfide reductase-like protein [Acididesulfobacillus acetoxydans]
MPVPRPSEGSGSFFAVNSAVLVVGDGPPAEAAVSALRAHPVFWVGATAEPGPHVMAYADESVAEVRGQRGRFRVQLEGKQGKLWLECGNVVLAPSLQRTLDPSWHLPESRLAVSVSRAARLAVERGPVVFLLGGGETEGYFSALTALREAVCLAARQVEVYFFFADLGVSWPGLEEVHQEARRLGVRFIRISDTSAFRVAEEGGFLRVRYTDAYLPGSPEFSLTATYVFAGEVGLPGSDFAELARTFRIDRDRWGFLQSDNVRLFPVRTNRPGVYVLGEARGPAFAGEAGLDAAAIAGETAPFLAGEILVAEPWLRVDPARCSFCLECDRYCPAVALEVHRARKTVAINPLACLGCGICAGVCPEHAIAYPGPETKSGRRQGKTIVFACEKSGYLAAQSIPLPAWAATLEMIPLPCAGRLDEGMVLRALAQGAVQVIVSACREQCCHYSSGERLAEEKVRALKEHLGSMGLNPGRVTLVRASANAPREWLGLVREIIAGDGTGPGETGMEKCAKT